MSQEILFPPARLIMGSLHKGNDIDGEGNPRVVKTGPKAGTPFTQYFFGVAVPKGREAHWNQTEWGQQVWAVGAAAFPAFHGGRTFAWKIEDGDSTEPNTKGRKPCDNEGSPGHWIVKFSSGFPPKAYQQTRPGVFQDVAAEAIKLGYWIQVAGNVASNGSAKSPGVYLNHNMVLFVRADTEIVTGPDAASVFGGAAISEPLPGVTALPAGFVMPSIPMTAAARAFVHPGDAVMPPIGTVLSPTFVRPNPAILALPALPAMPPAKPPEPALTAKGLASGFTYPEYLAGGWSDEVMRANGIIV